MYNRTSCTACQIIQLQANNSKLYSQIDDETTAFHHEYSRFQFNDPWPRDSAHKCPQQALPNKEKSKEHPKYVRIEEYFNENPKASIKDGARALKIPKSAVRGGLKKKFGLKWFLDRHGQELTNAMKAQRKKNLPMAFGTARRLPTSNNFWR